MNTDDRILVTGAGGFVGRNLVAYLRSKGFSNVKSAKHCDLTSREDTWELFDDCRPDYVFHCAAKVFGIAGNMQNQCDSYVTNLRINTNVVEACRDAKVKKIVAMGSVAIYPDHPKDGIAFREDDIWCGPPHHSEYGYAQAKRAMLANLEVSGLEYAYAISTNLYGPHDRFNVETGHVIPSLIRKFYEADDVVSVWGDGSALRDFMYVGDAVRALCNIMDKVEGPINLATGTSYSIGEVVDILSTLSRKRVVWDTTKPVGQLHRHYNVNLLMASIFSPAEMLHTGLVKTWEWYKANQAIARKL